MKDTPVILELNSISKTVITETATLPILNDISLAVTKGDTIAIMGRSGAGKSTLLSLMAGLDTPSTGEIYFDHHLLSGLSEEARANLRLGKVGFVFQSFQLLGHLSALENVMLPLELQNHPTPKEASLAILEKVGLADRVHHTPMRLSGGEQQRVALARAFVIRPILLFADEPTGNLEEETGKRIADLLFELNATHQTTLVLVTHDKTLAARCQKSFLLADHQLTQL